VVEHNLYMSNLYEYLDGDHTNARALALAAPRPRRREERQAEEEEKKTTEKGIRFEGVSFRYPVAKKTRYAT